MDRRFTICVLFMIAVALTASSQTTILYKKVADLPAYLKLTKPVAPLKGIVPPGIKKQSNVVIVNRKNPAAVQLVKLPGAFAEGMNPEYAIHASYIVKNADQRIALLTSERFPAKQKMIYPLKVNDVYSYYLSAPLDLSHFNHQLLHIAWKATVNSDGSFYLSSNAFGGRLGVNGDEIRIFPESEIAKTKWIAYQHGWCSAEKIWLYNPYSKTVLGRSISGANVALKPVKLADPLAYKPTAGVDITWDFSGFRTYAPDNSNHPSFYEYKAMAVSDRDGDGFAAIECGGDDCNDADGSVHPGSPQVCDGRFPGKDNDCDPRTYGQRDMDGDGFFDADCFQVDAAGNVVAGGTDCDDRNPAIIPGAMKYISATQVEVCGLGLCTVEKGMKAVRQPNGTAIVVPESQPVAKR